MSTRILVRGVIAYLRRERGFDGILLDPAWDG
jgi:hypothetical protein